MNYQKTVKYVKRGIANTYDDVIELHEGLLQPEYKVLHDWVLNHEQSHDDGAMTTHDALLDVKDTIFKPKIVSQQYWKFYFTHKGAWWQSSPVMPHNGGLTWDLSKLWQLIIIISFLGAVAWFLAR